VAGLSCRDLVLGFPLPGGGVQCVVDIPSLEIAPGAAIGITGPSGSGKSSLLHLLCGILSPDRGAVRWDDVDVAQLGPAAADAWRRRHVGLVFQDFQLFAGMTALENVLLPASFLGWRVAPELARRGRALLDRLALGALAERRVERLSRGEMQRVALARALLLQPPILLADEPTASLDPANAAALAALLLELREESGATLIVVSHDRAVLARLATLYRLEAGRLAPFAATEAAAA
jgi:ABC-type lipoprotein export system ATPase subunit